MRSIPWRAWRPCRVCPTRILRFVSATGKPAVFWSERAYEKTGVPRVAATWGEAIDRIENDPLMTRILPTAMIQNLVMTKRQELARFAETPPERHWISYLEAV